jgi:hypothetical protein
VVLPASGCEMIAKVRRRNLFGEVTIPGSLRLLCVLIRREVDS